MNLRQLFTRYIIIFAVCIILCNQIMHLHIIYKQQSILYTQRYNNLITGAIYEFNKKSANFTNSGISFNVDSNILVYNQYGWITKYQLDVKDDIRQITERSYYDIRNPYLWSLRNFYFYLKEKQSSLKEKNLSMQFAIQDSTGTVIYSYPKAMCILPAHPEYRETLGYISGDVLYATYNYPIGLFIQTAYGQITLTIFITALFALCIYNLYSNYHNEKRSGVYREQYIHSLVHDLKRPVENQIKLCYLLADIEKSEQTELLKQSGEQLKEMLQSISRMLLQSTDAYGLRLNLKEFDLKKMLETLAQPHRWIVEEGKKFEIRPRFLSTDSIIIGDPHFLYAVFQNFVDNSLKYSGQHAKVDITCKDLDEEHIQIEIKDNGLGISPEALKHVFERYNRGDRQDEQTIEGYGQGLYYARMIINAHRGKITIESTPGEETTIVLILPRNQKH